MLQLTKAERLAILAGLVLLDRWLNKDDIESYGVMESIMKIMEADGEPLGVEEMQELIAKVRKGVLR